MRTRLTAVVAVLGVTAGSLVLSAAQVDQHWLGMWREAQTHRPSTLSDRGRIAAPTEPGTPLVITGQILGPDGATPQPNAVVFAYHTGDDGVYSSPDRPGHPWRLQGWVETDASGRFTFETIRPAPYPGRKVPAHVHVTIETARYGRQFGGLQFADDPLVSAADREKSAAAGRFADVLSVADEGRAQHVHLNIRLKPKGDF